MTTTFYPSLRYTDAEVAIAWLERAFGFEPGDVERDEAGRVAHAELWLNGAAIMIGEGDVRDAETYAAIDDLDSLYERATAAGAEIERELADTDYGSREFSARDFSGRLWHFGTYRATPKT
jgi:uncharacterized glyoxalase superfamily protein PhnB